MATGRAASEKSVDAYRTISEVAAELDLPPHVLRFWESRFPQLRPLKRAGGRRFYRPVDVALLRDIRVLLHDQGYTIKGVQRLLRERTGKEGAAPAMGAGGGVVDRNSSEGGAPAPAVECVAERSPSLSPDGAASAGINPDTLMKSAPSAPASMPASAVLRAALATIEDCERRLREALASRG